MTDEEMIKEIEETLPRTFYSNLELNERVEMMVMHWRRATKICQELQQELDKIKENNA